MWSCYLTLVNCHPGRCPLWWHLLNFYGYGCHNLQTHNWVGPEEGDLGQSSPLVLPGAPQPGYSVHVQARLAHVQSPWLSTSLWPFGAGQWGLLDPGSQPGHELCWIMTLGPGNHMGNPGEWQPYLWDETYQWIYQLTVWQMTVLINFEWLLIF